MNQAWGSQLQAHREHSPSSFQTQRWLLSRGSPPGPDSCGGRGRAWTDRCQPWVQVSVRLRRVRIGASYAVFLPLHPQGWEMDTRVCWGEAGCRDMASTQGDCDVAEGPPASLAASFLFFSARLGHHAWLPSSPLKLSIFPFLPLFYLWLPRPLTIALFLQTREPAMRISSRASSVPAGLGRSPFRTLWPFCVPVVPSGSFQSLFLSAVTGRKLLFVRGVCMCVWGPSWVMQTQNVSGIDLSLP